MSWALHEVSPAALIAWVEQQAQTQPAHAGGYQGQVYLYPYGERRLAIKAATGRGVFGWARRLMLRREARVYDRLTGFTGAPRCYGLLAGRYLVLDYVDGIPLRATKIADRDSFFPLLLGFIQELHRRGVAHADLKRKDNLLVVGGRTPCLIDFGAAIVRKPGWRPINRFLFSLACQFDYNAWVKLKYRRLKRVPAEDLAYFRLTPVEKLARIIKRGYVRMQSLLSPRKP